MYDNIQASTSPLIEQREGAPPKVSETVSVIYLAFNADRDNTSLPRFRTNWWKTEEFSYAHDIRQTREQLESTSTSLSFMRFGCYAASRGRRTSSTTRPFNTWNTGNSPQITRQNSIPCVRYLIEEASVQGNVAQRSTYKRTTSNSPTLSYL